ncbi:glycosyl hydrolase family protein [Xylanimonas allomyrinae]|uniref:beta-glucosidase n=1 Tax=Xylanimonas allomyrinae TaxID=2509459 RepID=A0A4P6EL74_9MICO|nr:family 1 glycosylhydrolase [Xylanimonas allomyrinae]QAY63422.1 glycosyl hydrolase family protein [Xylanimonas allomyrinae]
MSIVVPGTGARRPAPGTTVPFTPSTPLPATSPTGDVAFPPGFLWGTATAAFQIEGATREGGRTDSIWDTFARIPGAVTGGDDGTVACDHYHRYRDDVALMRSLNLGAYRFSTSWARVRPDGGAPNPQGLAFYDRLVDELLDVGILPWVTLYHWDLPQAVEDAGGWPVRDTAYRFADYAMTVHDALHDRVRVWTTLNEPWCSSFLSYTGGEHAPGRTSRHDGVAAAHHLLLGHGLAAAAIQEVDPAAVVGLTVNLTVADPADPSNPDDVAAAAKHDGLFNRMFLDPVLRGDYPADVRDWVAPYGLDDLIHDGDLAIISTPLDALGVNYYNGSCIAATPPAVVDEAVTDRPDGVRDDDDAPVRATLPPTPSPEGVHHHARGLPRTAMGWEVQPEGLTRLLTRVHRDYTGPRGMALYVTENGAAYDDVPDADGFVDDAADRLAYLDAHLRAVKDAIDAGADVRGYFAWSLLDNFEWAHGYSKRFGIVRTDYETQRRTIKASGRWYAEVARTGVVPGREES